MNIELDKRQIGILQQETDRLNEAIDVRNNARPVEDLEREIHLTIEGCAALRFGQHVSKLGDQQDRVALQEITKAFLASAPEEREAIKVSVSAITKPDETPAEVVASPAIEEPIRK